MGHYKGASKAIEKSEQSFMRDCGLPATCSGIIFVCAFLTGLSTYCKHFLVQKALQCPHNSVLIVSLNKYQCMVNSDRLWQHSFA